MTSAQGDILLPIARAAISQALNVPRTADESAPWLAERAACFVTLTQQGELRGCIGTLEAHRTLLDDVKSNAVSAAFHDPRFAPLRAYELPGTRVEVSVLSAPEPMSFRDEADVLAQLRPHEDGIVLEYGLRRSTFLPQVWEQLPEADAFLARLKQKAGLLPHFWADGIRLSRYSVRKWKEQPRG